MTDDVRAIPDAGSYHPWYGPCDMFGPLWTCCECTGVIACDDGTFTATDGSGKISAMDAAARVGDFLMRRIEMAAVAAWGCSDSPVAMEGFMRRSLWMDLPGDPWRNPERANDALTPENQSLTARGSQ